MSGDLYTFAGLVTLEAGSWADWISGAGSFAAVGAALVGYWFVDRQRYRDDRDRERHLAESIEWKILVVLNDTLTIAKHLKSGLENDRDTAFRQYQFASVQPLGIPTGPAPQITSDEVSFLMTAKAPTVLMELSDSIKRYDSIRHAMREYQTRHEALFRMMPQPKAFNGDLFTYGLTGAQMDEIRPHAVIIDALLNGIINLTGEGVERAQTMLDDFEARMQTHFAKWHVQVDKGDYASFNLMLFRSEPWPRQSPS